MKKPKKFTKVQELEQQVKTLQGSNERLANKAREADTSMQALVEALWPYIEERIRDEVKDLVAEAVDQIHVEVTR